MEGIVMRISGFVYNYIHIYINTILVFMTIIKIKHRLWNPWNKKCVINGILSKINLKTSHSLYFEKGKKWNLSFKTFQIHTFTNKSNDTAITKKTQFDI